MKQPISVVICCKDNSQQLATCVDRCLDFADEILIAELDDRANAFAIAAVDKRVKVVAHEPIRQDDFLNWSISQASHDWVLLLDADERLNRELADEIELALSRGATHDAFTVDRETFVNGRRMEAATPKGSRRVRLFRRGYTTFVQTGSTHSIETESSSVGKLSNKIRRHPDWRFELALANLADVGSEQAQTWNAEGKGHSATKMLFSPLWQFAIQYFWRGSIFDGSAGVRVAWQEAFRTFCAHGFLSDLQSEVVDQDEIEINRDTIDLLDPTFRRAA